LEYTANELMDQIKASKNAYVVLCADLESNPDDMALSFCVESLDSHIKDLVRELRRIDGEFIQKALFADNENLPTVATLSGVKSFFHLMGYYVANGLKKVEDGICALKRDMGVLNVRGEAEIPPDEELAVLEDAVLLGYWKVFHANANG